MAKYPFVKQDASKECGVACISMLIKYYHGYIGRCELLEMTKTNKSGTTLYHLVSALKEIGFEAEGISCNYRTLIKNKIHLPCICNVIIDGSFKHFVVLYEMNKKGVIIGDPAVGIRKLPLKSFEIIYNDALVLAILKKTIPIINESKYYNLFWIIKNNINLVRIVILYSLVITVLSIISSFYFGSLVDNISSIKNIITFLFIIFFTIAIIKIVLDYIKNKVYITLNKRIDISLTKDILMRIISLPYKHYKNHTTGDIISRINDLNNLKDIVSKILISAFIDIPLIMVSIVLLFRLNRNLFMISFIILVLNVLSMIIFKKILFKEILRFKRRKSIDTSTMLDSINAFETVKGINIQNFVMERLNTKHIDSINSSTLIQKILIIRRFISNIINDLGLMVIDYIGILLIYDNKLKLSILITFNTVLSYFFSSINSVLEFSLEYNEIKSSLKRINDIMLSEKDNGFIDKYRGGTIIYHNLSYTFDDITYPLKNINLTILDGEKLVVIGKSGSGKSTLFKLLKGYYKVDSGLITINDIDITNYKKDALFYNILYVNQNEILFNDTLLNNIKLGSCDNNLLLKVCEICEINSIVKKDSLGMNMLIEENGFNLSGGERQRIILARSLMHSFDILIIDEALNQVDIKMERRILRNIFLTFPLKTIIFISHRLNNCDMFNHIIELKEGEIIKDEQIDLSKFRLKNSNGKN